MLRRGGLLLWVVVGLLAWIITDGHAQRGTREQSKVSSPKSKVISAPPIPGLQAQDARLQTSPSTASAAATIGPATNRPWNITVAWNAAADHALVTNYALSYGIASGVYTNSVNAGTNLTATVSNLVRGLRYYFAVRATGPNAISPFSAERFWPQPFTNYIGVGIKTNGRVIVQLLYTNPPGDVVMFEPFIFQTNDAVSVLRLTSGHLLVSNTNQP